MKKIKREKIIIAILKQVPTGLYERNARSLWQTL